MSIVTDDFSRVLANLGSLWDPPVVGQVLVVPGGECTSSVAGGTNITRYSGNWTSDQTVVVTASPVTYPTQNIGPAARIQANGDCYYLIINRLWVRHSGGTELQLAVCSQNVLPGDVMTLSAIGSLITVLRNGVQVAQATDTRLTGGRPGLYAASNTVRITDWSADGFIPPPPIPGGTVADDFNRANTNTLVGLGPNWTKAYGPTGAVVVANNVAAGSASGTMITRYTAAPFHADQSAQGLYLGHPTSAQIGPAVRLQASGDGYYILGSQMWRRGGAGNIAIGGNFLSLTVPGDILKITAVGSELIAYKNGQQMVRGTDTTFPTGLPGIYCSEANTWVLDDWVAEGVDVPDTGGLGGPDNNTKLLTYLTGKYPGSSTDLTTLVSKDLATRTGEMTARMQAMIRDAGGVP